MKHLHLYSFLIFFVLIGCGPELQTVINRDQYNRIILEAELKGEADTLWSKVYTYHYDEGSSNEEEPSTDKTDVSLDDAGNATWGEEEVQEDAIEENSEEITAETDSLAPKVYIITADTTKKTFSSYAKGNKEGEWKTWYPNGMLKTEFFYQKNQIEGLYTYYDSLGVIKKSETYKKSILDGVTSDYNENGALIKTTDYKKGIITGFIKEFLEGIVLLEQKTFKKDSLDGEWTSWYDNGTQMVIRLYKNGKPIGNWIFNDEKGEWMREEQYKKGLAHGIWSFFDDNKDKVFQYYTEGKLIAEYTEAKWPNGQIKEVPAFKNGLPHGTWIGYWADGSTRYTIDYKKGDKDGDELRYDSTGVLIFEVKYSKGIRNGIEKEYFGNGQLKRSAKYKDNKLNGKTEHFDSLGVRLETIAYKDSLRDGKTTIWWPNGEAYQRYTYERGILEGKYEEWDSLGTDIVTGDYVDGKRDKKWLYFDSEGRRDNFVFLDMDSIITDYEFNYYPNWQIVEEPSFNDEGLFDGKWESFYVDGATSKEYAYDQGKKEGIWQSYYQDGRRDNYTFYDQDSLITDYDFKYYQNLQIVEEPKFSKDGLFDGKWEQYFGDGEIKKTFSYDMGKKNKVWQSYYQDGRRDNYTFYDQDSLITDYDFKYHHNLQIMEEPKFSKDGLFDGKWEQYFGGGEIKKTFYYDRNKKDKAWESYFRDGREENFTFYDQDTLITDYDYKYYDNLKPTKDPDLYDFEYYMNLQVVEKPRNDNLQIVEKPNFNRQGLFDGKWESFFDNGDTWRTFYYDNGKKSNLWSVYYDSTGTRHSETNYANDLKEGMYLEWYEGVKEDPRVEGLYVEDKKHEIWSYWNEFAEKRLEVWENGVLLHSYKYEYYDNGQVKEEPSYVNGKMHGDWVRYFPNGDIKGTRVFREDLKEGLWMEYHRNPPGKGDDILAWQGKYIADKREGKWEWFWLNTNLQRREVFKNDEIISQKCFERDGSGRERKCLEVRSQGN